MTDQLDPSLAVAPENLNVPPAENDQQQPPQQQAAAQEQLLPATATQQDPHQVAAAAAQLQQQQIQHQQQMLLQQQQALQAQQAALMAQAQQAAAAAAAAGVPTPQGGEMAPNTVGAPTVVSPEALQQQQMLLQQQAALQAQAQAQAQHAHMHAMAAEATPQVQETAAPVPAPASGPGAQQIGQVDVGSAAGIDAIVGNGPGAKYIKRRHLGQGSFGSAWKVEDSTTATPYAAKLMNTNNMSAKDRGFVANEVRCLSCCSHPNVVKHVLSTDVEGMILIIMEYADGGDLYKQIKARQQGMKYFKEHEILFIFLQLCLALDHIHSKRMMHRDLKTANVLLTATGLVKLGDFGFSRQYEDSLSNPVGSTFCGTPYYLSPELWRRAPYSKKSEMWALGVVLYEVMALKRPFGGKNMDELIDNIIHARYDPLPETYSPDLRNVVAQLLQLEPSQRPSLRQLFQQPYVRSNGLLTLKRSVENHGRIPAAVRSDLVRSIDSVLSSGLTEYEGPRVVPRKGILKRHAADHGWKDCELELNPQKIIMRDPHDPTAPEEVVELAALTSVCPIDASIAIENFVFAMKNQTGRAYWFKENDQDGFHQWLTALQNAMPY